MAHGEAPTVCPPVAIFRVLQGSHRYMLYDINVVSWLRKEHRIGGVLMGSLPQVPQQNVFLGLPLQLMPEEARLLVDDGLAYIVDDAEAHSQGVNSADPDVLQRYLEQLRLDGQIAAAENAQRKAEKRVLSQKMKAGVKTNDALNEVGNEETVEEQSVDTKVHPEPEVDSRPQPPAATELPPWPVTPATSSALIPCPATSKIPHPIVDPPSYALFRHLHKSGYFLSPGLRFGCQFMAYPGDSLRYHSHFLCVASDWHEEMSLLDLLARGRLGTGVKKGFLLGGAPPDQNPKSQDVRCFCIEWAGM